MVDSKLRNRIQEFIEKKGKSCSFDPELITPLYVYRMWGGKASLEEIERAMEEVRGKTEEIYD